MDGTLAEQQEPVETYHVYPIHGGVVILKEEAETQGSHTIETTLATQQAEKKKEPHTWPAFALGMIYLLCSSLMHRVSGVLYVQSTSSDNNHSHDPNASHNPCNPQCTGASIDAPFVFPKTNEQHNRTRPPDSNPGKRISDIL